MVLICSDCDGLECSRGLIHGKTAKKNRWTGVVHCEVSCDWQFHPVPASRNFRKNGLLLSPSVFSSCVAAKNKSVPYFAVRLRCLCCVSLSLAPLPCYFLAGAL